jgi:Bardet-Biedl syndrome 5 protein
MRLLLLLLLQVKSVRVSDSKFGVALVVETTARSGGYVLGFRVEPRETLDYVHKEITALWQVGDGGGGGGG